jgi:hypothetical protein
MFHSLSSLRGEIDQTHTTIDDIITVETLLAPSISYIANITGNNTLDILQLLTFYFVSDYRLSLMRFGQIVPGIHCTRCPHIYRA